MAVKKISGRAAWDHSQADARRQLHKACIKQRRVLIVHTGLPCKQRKTRVQGANWNTFSSRQANELNEIYHQKINELVPTNGATALLECS